jgi:hypothetical protein
MRMACYCTAYGCPICQSEETECDHYKPRTDETEMEVAINVIQDMTNSLQIFPDSRQGKALLKAIDALKDKRPEGEWLKDEEYGTANRICPFCGAYDTDQLHTNFCARCGAKLNGEASGIKKKMQDAEPSKMFYDLSEEDKIDAITNGKCKSKLLQIKEEISNMDFKDKIEIDQDFIYDMKERARFMAVVEGDKDIDHAGDNLFKHEKPVYVPLDEIIEVIDKYINEEEE